MGLIYAPATISNPADRTRSWQGTFLIDTGATDTLVPRDVLESIGITPDGQRECILADGKDAKFDTAVARIEFMGEIIGSTIVFGEVGTDPLLGAIAMQDAGIVVDPCKETLLIRTTCSPRSISLAPLRVLRWRTVAPEPNSVRP